MNLVTRFPCSIEVILLTGYILDYSGQFTQLCPTSISVRSRMHALLPQIPFHPSADEHGGLDLGRM